MTEKSDILEKLNRMSVDEIDALRDKKQLELKELEKKYHLARDSEVARRFEMKIELCKEYTPIYKINHLLSVDETLYKLKRLIIQTRSLIDEKRLELSILERAFWRNKL